MDLSPKVDTHDFASTVFPSSNSTGTETVIIATKDMETQVEPLEDVWISENPFETSALSLSRQTEPRDVSEILDLQEHCQQLASELALSNELGVFFQKDGKSNLAQNRKSHSSWMLPKSWKRKMYDIKRTKIFRDYSSNNYRKCNHTCWKRVNYSTCVVTMIRK